jgi:C1A family cysteine protease
MALTELREESVKNTLTSNCSSGSMSDPLPCSKFFVPMTPMIDWSHISGPVVNQGTCGSCYVFAALNVLETTLRISSLLKDTDTFSVQHVLDCSAENNVIYLHFFHLHFVLQGCDGGNPDKVFNFINKHGICLGQEYPVAYDARHRSDGVCLVEDCVHLKGSLIGVTNIDSGDTKALKEVLRSSGPVAVLLSGYGESFKVL